MPHSSPTPLAARARQHGVLPEHFARIGRRIFHRRMHVGLTVVVLMALCIRPRPLFGDAKTAATLGSLILVLIGLAGRAWAGGCAGRHTRRATIEAPRLVTGGPYAHVRNPIYFASLFVGLGMVGLLGDPWMLVPCAAVFAFLYISIVPAEEEFLEGQFGEEYRRYRANVPRIIPRLRAWPDATPATFDRSAIFQEARLGLVLIAIFTGMRAAAWWRGVTPGFW